MEYPVAIHSDPDATRAIMQTRRSAEQAGFDPAQVSMLGTVASELVRNILKYAGAGELVVRTLDTDTGSGLELTATDRGPGIDDLDSAMRDHVSTGGTLGLGLPGVRRMMDSFRIASEPGRGVTVTVSKWLGSRSLDDDAPSAISSSDPPPERIGEATQRGDGAAFDVGSHVRPTAKTLRVSGHCIPSRCRAVTKRFGGIEVFF